MLGHQLMGSDIQELLLIDLPAPQETEATEQGEQALKRHTTVRYFKQMHPQRCFPMVVTLSAKQLRALHHSKLEQVEGEEARSDSSGLGLAIVKRILDLHGSRITVTSQLDSGTEFQFDLPVYQQVA